MTSFLKKFILPKEIDFICAMHQHAEAIKKITDDLEKCMIEQKTNYCQNILDDTHQAAKIRDENMQNLLNTFITPIDRESIYRIITQLDWVSISIRHLIKKQQAFGVEALHGDYAPLIQELKLQAELLTAGFRTIKSNPVKTAESAKRVRESYDTLVAHYIRHLSNLFKEEEFKKILINKELLSQIKDISQHLRMSANSLEDVVMKMS